MEVVGAVVAGAVVVAAVVVAAVVGLTVDTCEVVVAARATLELRDDLGVGLGILDDEDVGRVLRNSA